MKPKTITRIVIDWFMIVLLMAQMGRHFWGNTPHEWIGAGMFVLFITHHALNLNWYKTMFRGKYTPYRIGQLIIDILVLAAMSGLMVSGIMLSQQVFVFLHFSGGTSFARILHMLATYWGFALMGLHLGLHWNGFLGWHRHIVRKMARKDIQTPPSSPSPIRATLLNIAGVAIAAYGVYVFIQRDLPSYMFVQNLFVFLDYDESKILFYLDYLAMTGAFIWVGHYVAKGLRKRSGGKPKQPPEVLPPCQWKETPNEKSHRVCIGGDHDVVCHERLW